MNNEGIVFVVLDIFGLFDESLGFRCFRMNKTPPPHSLCSSPSPNPLSIPLQQSQLFHHGAMELPPAEAGPTITTGTADFFTLLFHPSSCRTQAQSVLSRLC
ncbi:hypothetical protein BLNAU_21442 [Blattamonas nauphoetae]|uniref:Uncharacterized protein n=1 Tax=Blattamonas nauphoetae TaxID=2049346 RepID=A0ABQ9WK60_9EUKA|nr:hypothetical protein BLNAU_25235 [Blattamonas nauphoetae]KAK2943652.1 hypothetical protein BLNAU_21442 [Blattamonas nauphoetae]